MHAARGGRGAEEKRAVAGGKHSGGQPGNAAGAHALRLGAAGGLGLGAEKTRQIAPAIAGRLDPLAADREHLALDLLAAEALVEEPAGVVAQYPDDRRAAA